MEGLPDNIKQLSKKLTPKQLKFADAYVECGNSNTAAQRAGYSKRTSYSIGPENLAKPPIKKYIDARLELLSSDKIADQQEVMEFLTDVMRGTVREKVVSASGKEVDVPTANKEKIKAAELLGKRYSMFTDRVQNDVSGSVELNNLKDLSSDELASLADAKIKGKYDVNKEYNT